MKRWFAVMIWMGLCAGWASAETYDAVPFEPLDSKVLKGVNYDPAQQIMRVKMRDETVIQFSGVPQEIYKGLLEHPLKGGYYKGYIAGRYPTQVVWSLYDVTNAPPAMVETNALPEAAETNAPPAEVKPETAKAPPPAAPAPEAKPATPAIPVAEAVPAAPAPEAIPATPVAEVPAEETIPSLSVVPEEPSAVPPVTTDSVAEVMAPAEELLQEGEKALEQVPAQASVDDLLSEAESAVSEPVPAPAPAPAAAPAAESSTEETDALLQSLDEMLK